ncbi:MAG: hypothetical protein KI793_30745, partial [Rivularia sp. (in: Bacteria)]|nr:hypothetical protein [Rivularia sp. MS3]
MKSSENNSNQKINKQSIDFTNSSISISASFSSSGNTFDGGIKSALDIGNVVIGNGQWIIDDETTQESLIAEVRTDVDERIDSLFNKLRDRLPLNETEEKSAGNPFTEENPFAGGENPFGEEEFTPPPGYVNSSLPSQEIVDNIKSVKEENPVLEDSNSIDNSTQKTETDNPVVEDSNSIDNSTQETETDNPVVEDSNSIDNST